ncbi:MAG: type II secretion system protein [Candidatus Gracilibacteria bacterium]|nr:type II secretion system protein [Candidatus Gracilibacteria bacterium]
MKKNINKINAFTLIEVIVSITIFSIVMVSVFAIFFLVSDLSNKTDINRLIQENIKTITETIAEDIRQNGINICEIGENCHKFDSSSLYVKSDSLYIGQNHYYLAKFDENTNDYIKVGNPVDCSNISDNCVIIRQNPINGKDRLCNSWVQFSDLNFYISRDYEPKVTINFSILPASGKGIKSTLIKNNKIIFQTTLGERFYLKK